MQIKGDRFLVIGGAGFIGSHLVRQLLGAGAAHVCNFSRGTLAALWLLQYYEYPRSAFAVNVAGPMIVIKAVIASGVKRLVFSSSASVYGDAVTEPREEEHPFNCQEFYGASKLCGEIFLHALITENNKKSAVSSMSGCAI